jgi:hypothetical protein
VLSRAIDVHHDQLGGAHGTHDDANPCQTSTPSTLFQRCALSGHELTATRCRPLACSGGLSRPDKAEVSGSSPLRPTPPNPAPSSANSPDQVSRHFRSEGAGGTHDSSVRRSSTTSADPGSFPPSSASRRSTASSEPSSNSPP